MFASGLNGWPLMMPIAASMPSPIGIGEVGALAVHKLLELVERAAVADRQHVGWDAGSVGELHWLGRVFAIQWIDLRLFDQRDGRCQVLWVLIERTQEDEDIVGP